MTIGATQKFSAMVENHSRDSNRLSCGRLVNDVTRKVGSLSFNERSPTLLREYKP